VAPVDLENSDIVRTRDRNMIAGVALTVAALVAAVLIAAIAALGYADSERDRELRRWQDRLGLIADTRAGAVEDWLRNQYDALGALADNASVRLYMSELSTLPDAGERVTKDLARSGYLQNLLTVLAEREGFVSADTGADVNANVERSGTAGLALLDDRGNPIAATAGTPPIDGVLRDFVTDAEPGTSAFLDVHPGPSGVPTIALMAPVFAIHSSAAMSRPSITFHRRKTGRTRWTGASPSTRRTSPPPSPSTTRADSPAAWITAATRFSSPRAAWRARRGRCSTRSIPPRRSVPARRGSRRCFWSWRWSWRR
jgi:hypothetical protein